MNARVYTINGRVIDGATRVGVPGVVVEAWDRDTRFHDMLGSTVTNSDGAFFIAFDPNYFGDYGGDTSPDLFFRVYRDQQLLLDTMPRTDMNIARGPHDVTLEIGAATTIPPDGKDRVTTQQLFKVATFFKQSDFAGVAREQRSKASMIGGFAGKLLQSGLKNFNLNPIKPTGTQTNEIVGQPTSVAQANLARNQVAVSDVKTFQPGANKDSLIALTSAPLLVKSDDTVTLYEENGVVQYYSVNKPAAATSVDAATVARLDGEGTTLKSNVSDLASVRDDVANIKATFGREQAQLSDQVANVQTQVDEVAGLKAQLNDLRQSTASKDAEIATLKQQMIEVRDANADLVRRLSPDLIARLQTIAVQTHTVQPATPVSPIAVQPGVLHGKTVSPEPSKPTKKKPK